MQFEQCNKFPKDGYLNDRMLYLEYVPLVKVHVTQADEREENKSFWRVGGRWKCMCTEQALIMNPSPSVHIVHEALERDGKAKYTKDKHPRQHTSDARSGMSGRMDDVISLNDTKMTMYTDKD